MGRWYVFVCLFIFQFFKVIPTGMCHVKFKSDGHHFSWKKPITTIHNILVGSLYVDQVLKCLLFTLHCWYWLLIQNISLPLIGWVPSVDGWFFIAILLFIPCHKQYSQSESKKPVACSVQCNGWYFIKEILAMLVASIFPLKTEMKEKAKLFYHFCFAKKPSCCKPSATCLTLILHDLLLPTHRCYSL